MKKGKMIMIILAVVFIITGGSMMAGAYLSMSKDASSQTAAMEFVENTHTVTDDFTTIRISTINSSIELLPSPDGVCRIVCNDSEKLYHKFSVNEFEMGAQLNIDQCDDWEWYEMLYGLYRADDLTLRIYLPKAEYTLVHLDSSSGDITIAPDFKFGTLSTNAGSGNTVLRNLFATHLTAQSSSGDISLCNVEAESDVFAETISGFTRIENLSALNLTVASSSGSTSLERITSDYLRATSNSGNIMVFDGSFHDTSHFENSSGSIEIMDSDCGDQTVQVSSGSVTLQNVTGSSLNVSTSSGDISLWDTLCSGNALCHTVSGEIMFTGLDAKNLEFITSSGDVSGNLLSGKKFITETSSGYVQVPPSDESAGTCHIQTVSGNISIAIKQ